MSIQTRCISAVLGAGAAAIATTGDARAGAMTFFDRDMHTSDTTRLAVLPNSLAAFNLFSSLLDSTAMDTLETIPANTSNPTLTFGGAATATVTGGVVRTVPAGQTDGEGRYPLSGSRYMNANQGAMLIEFTEPQQAFGFFGIDIGDFGGRLLIHQIDGAMKEYVIDPVSQQGQASGSVLFWGLIDADAPFTSIEIRNNTGVEDVFAFDNLVVGELGAVVPLPSGAGLGAAGLLGLFAAAGVRRRRSR